MRLSLLSVMLLVACVVGCNHSPEGGTTPNSTAGFKLSMPVSTGMKEIKQGDTETFNAEVLRDSEFKKDVKLTVTKPDKVDVKLNKETIKASDETKFTITVTPSKDAPLADVTVKVTGTAEGGGNPTTGEFHVKVVK